jgi:molybdopterin synthase catalytic subunit
MVDPVCQVLLTHEPLVPPAKGAPAESGALVDFWGVVRGLERELEIDGINYEAHTAMAEHQLRVIGEEAAGAFALKQVIIRHRIGFVGVGEASLFVRVGSSHRPAAFCAIEAVVDELKKRAPIWKHPRFKEGALRPAALATAFSA